VLHILALIRTEIKKKKKEEKMKDAFLGKGWWFLLRSIGGSNIICGISVYSAISFLSALDEINSMRRNK